MLVEVRPHAVAGCPVDARASLLLTALGDFDATPASFELVELAERNRQLGFPPETAGIEALATRSASRWLGTTKKDVSGNLELTLWDETGACDLGPTAGSRYPGPSGAGGQAIGFAPLAGIVLVAGGASLDNIESGGALVASIRTGRVELVAPERQANQRRAFATATAMTTSDGERVLVAGGFDPLAGDQLDALASAHLFDPIDAAFTRKIELIEPRARHGAVGLPGGGVLLIAGQDQSGFAKRTLEAIAPDGTSSIAGLATLADARIAPRVLSLDDGRTLVLGGTRNGVEPATQAEWLTADGRAFARNPVELPPRLGAGTVALPGGSALVVGGCDTTLARDVECPFSPCLAGCVSRGVIWLTADGVRETLAPLDIDPGPRPLLVAASDGSPWLFGSTEVRRFDPWSGRFVTPSIDPGAIPLSSLPPPLALEPGLFVWLHPRESGEPVLRGLRHDVRGPLSRDVAPLLLGDARHVAPNIPPSGTSIRYEPRSGLLLRDALGRAVVTDTRYADVRVEANVTAGSLPIVYFGGTPVGDFSCPWPDSGGTQPPETVVADRFSGVVVLRRGGEFRRCPVPSERLTVALGVGPGETSTIRSVRIRRLPIFE